MISPIKVTVQGPIVCLNPAWQICENVTRDNTFDNTSG